jgi:hypothetical protein
MRKEVVLSSSVSLESWNAEEAVVRCHKLARSLAANLTTFEEYADNLALTVVSVRVDDMPKCVGAIPPNLLGRVATLLHSQLKACDFMPSHVAVHLLSPYSNEELMAAKKLFRPKYLRLLELVEMQSK